MNTKLWSCCLLVGVAGAIGVSDSCAQEEVAAVPRPVTEQHEILKKDVGTWDAEVKIWPQGPEADPITSTGTETNRLVGDGVWLVSNFEGSIAGQPFEGHGQFGYDPVKRKYVGTWIDSMSPFLSSMEGTYDASTETLTMITEGRDLQSGKIVKSKSESRNIDQDHRTFTMSMSDPQADGKFVRIMQIDYTRRKE